MPSLELKTNVKLDDPKAFTAEFAHFAAKTLDKPLVYISTVYTYNETMTFNGTFDPALLMIITSLNNITPELNEAYSKAFFQYFQEKLGVPSDRGYITFYDPGLAYLGHKGTHFGTLFG